MRRFLLSIIAVVVVLSVAAQETKRLINIDPASFRLVQTDALSGVAVDSIGLDRSKRPCARIKMRINRMTREEIEQIMVQPIGGSVQLTRRDVSYEGNGLIIEMTAKQPTRFYIHHDSYGDSNEVSLDLLGNKEYYIEAQLDQFLPITVHSNMRDAEVYIDNRLCGCTNEQYILTIHDITPGEHTLRLEHAGRSSIEQKILVHKGNLYFRCNIDTAEALPQYVVIKVEPEYAMVFIDNEPQTTQSGYVQALLQNGTYNYRVIAKGYHEQSGTFTVAGEKVKFPVKLTANAAQVTITTSGGAEIWVNNERKGPSPWKGVLLSGSYIFEARKEGHRTTVLPQVITSNPAVQSYTLDAPTPIRGSMAITSVPAVADIYLDGQNIGQTPLRKEVIVGNHNIELRCQGYKPTSQTITVVEGKTSTHNIQLTKISQSSSVSKSNSAEDVAVTIDENLTTTCGPYKVGDLFHENGKKGVVIEVATDGMSGKIVSIAKASQLEYATTANEYKRVLGAVDAKNGANNLAKVKTRPNWQKNYPAFAWCAQLGEGWYLPAIEELRLFTVDDATRKAVSKTLREIGAERIRSEKEYLSSTETGGYTHGGERLVMGVQFYYKNQNASTPAYENFRPGTGKCDKIGVRAVSKFAADLTAKFVVEQRMKKCRIEYRSGSKVKIGGYSNSACEFGAKMLSHEFENGKGVITFDSYVTQIGANAFYGPITEITIPETVTSIEDEAFEGTKLESITIPSKLVSIGKRVFIGCKQLKEFKGPNATSDGKALIVNNVLVRVATQGMTSFAIPEGVTAIAKGAFGEAKNLKEIIVPSSLKSVDLIGFEYMNRYVVNIPEGITHIENPDFIHKEIIRATIPESATHIAEKAFWGCDNLKVVICKPTIPPHGANEMFHDWTGGTYGRSKPIGCKIYVPKESVKAYKSAEHWKTYKKYMRPMRYQDKEIVK